MLICEQIPSSKISPSAEDFFSNGDPIADQLPVVFDNGHEIQQITGSCIGCNTILLAKDFRGILTKCYHVCYLLAVGVCDNCCLYTNFRINFYQDGTVVHVNTDDTFVRGRFVKAPNMDFFEKIRQHIGLF